jgi:hypothetical protein
MVKASAPLLAAYFLAYRLTPGSLGFLPAPAAATPAALGMLDGFLMLALFLLTGVHVYYHFHNSITLRLLTEITRAPRESMTLAQIEATCGIQVLVDERLDALERARLLKRTADRLYPTAAGRVAAAAARLGRAMFQLSP